MNYLRICLMAGLIIFGMFDMTSAESTGSHALISNVPILVQYPELPTGCEATALTMLLQWSNVKVQKTEVAASFPQLPMPVYESEKWRGGNPNFGFVGDPFSANGFGVYHAPVAHLLDHYLPHRALDLSGSSFDQLLATIDSGRPVIAWVTSDLQEPNVKKTWNDDHGNVVQWMGPEHVVVMAGYTSMSIVAIDPGKGVVVTFPRRLFQQRWEQMGTQAVTVIRITENKQAQSYPKTKKAQEKKAQGLTNWLQTIQLFFRINNPIGAIYAKLFIVVFVSYYLSMLLITLIRKRKREE